MYGYHVLELEVQYHMFHSGDQKCAYECLWYTFELFSESGFVVLVRIIVNTIRHHICICHEHLT
jgi:hypothetical protein